jgi:hypothetical protein
VEVVAPITKASVERLKIIIDYMIFGICNYLLSRQTIVVNFVKSLAVAAVDYDVCNGIFDKR